jgi:hypothetical protein
MVFQFFLRDFSGMLGGVLFATLQVIFLLLASGCCLKVLCLPADEQFIYLFIFFVQGSGLDNHAKQWRLFADCLNNVGKVVASDDFNRIV